LVDWSFVLISDWRFIGESRDVSLNRAFNGAIDCARWSAFAILEQVLEQLAIVDDRGAKVLCARCVSFVTFGDRARSAIVTDEPRMMNGEIGGALLEVRDGISAGLHYFLDERVGAGDGARRVVDEHFLDAPPLLGEQVSLIGEQRTNLEVLNSLLSLDELFLGTALTADLMNSSGVLRPIPFLERFGSTFPICQVPDHASDNDKRNKNPDDRGCAHGFYPPPRSHAA
jgi:hypothetical protein